MTEQSVQLPPIDGAHLVLAGPGTGKTTLLVERAEQILGDRTRPKRKVLALTFTNKAAGEMRTRLRQAVADLEARVFVGTFHSFGRILIRAHGSLVGIPGDFVVFDRDDQLELIQQLQSEGKIPDGIDSRSLVEEFSRRKTRLEIGLSPSQQPDGVERFHDIYVGALRALNALDFGDLLVETIRVLQTQPAVQHLYRVAYGYVLVDEFQDTNPAQYELLKLLADTASLSLFAVADEDQLIFEWNEARLETLNRYCSDFGASVFYSTLSHRCPQRVVEAANAVISNNRFRFPDKPEIRSVRTEDYPIIVKESPDYRGEAVFVTQSIRGLLASGIAATEIAVIGRVRRVLDAIEAELQAAGIPAGRPSIAGLKQSEEAQTLFRLFRWLQNPRDDQSARHVLRFLHPQLSEEIEVALQARAERRPLRPSQPDAVSTRVQELRHTLELFNSWRLFVGDTQQLFAELRQRLPGLFTTSPEEQARLEEMLRIVDELDSFRVQLSPRGRVPLPDLVFSLPQVVGGASAQAAAGGSGAVSLLTYHQAKGLEFDAVFLVAMEDGIFPDFRSSHSTRSMEEERRLFYVGITRTRARLYLTWARQRPTVRGAMMAREPSPFLSEIPPALVQHAS